MSCKLRSATAMETASRYGGPFLHQDSLSLPHYISENFDGLLLPPSLMQTAHYLNNIARDTIFRQKHAIDKVLNSLDFPDPLETDATRRYVWHFLLRQAKSVEECHELFCQTKIDWVDMARILSTLFSYTQILTYAEKEPLLRSLLAHYSVDEITNILSRISGMINLASYTSYASFLQTFKKTLGSPSYDDILGYLSWRYYFLSVPSDWRKAYRFYSGFGGELPVGKWKERVYVFTQLSRKENVENKAYASTTHLASLTSSSIFSFLRYDKLYSLPQLVEIAFSNHPEQSRNAMQAIQMILQSKILSLTDYRSLSQIYMAKKCRFIADRISHQNRIRKISGFLPENLWTELAIWYSLPMYQENHGFIGDVSLQWESLRPLQAWAIPYSILQSHNLSFWKLYASTHQVRSANFLNAPQARIVESDNF